MTDNPEMRQVLRVLIVEDNPLDANVCLYRLNRSGFEVIADIIETREQFAERLANNDYDIILSDYGLPGWTGLGALEYLQRTGRDIPFILVTGTLGEETAVKCIKMGASDYVLKDRLARLPIAVRQTLEEKSLVEAKRLAEQELHRSNQRIVNILETIDDAFFALDRDWQVIYLNPKAQSFLRKLQRNRRDLRGQVFWNEFPQGINSIFEAELTKASQDQVMRTFENFFPSLNQHFEIRAFPSPDGVSVYVRDVTERKNLEENQARLISELQEALGRVKTLTGLLPICASCKKIRDDRGDWNRIENYVTARSEAVFTHGLCPDCVETMYPELVHKLDKE